MRTTTLRWPFLLMAVCLTCYSLIAQTSIRTIAQGGQGKTALFVTLPANQHISFALADAKKMLELDPNSNLVLISTEKDELGFEHHRMFQTYNNIPIENSMYIFHTMNGKLSGMSGVAVLEFDEQMQNATPSISADKATLLAIKHVGAEIYAFQDEEMEQQLKQATSDANATYVPSPSLVWYSPGDEVDARNLHLAYKVDVYAAKPLSRAFYFVDAQTGEVLGKKDELFYSDAVGTANTAYSGTQTLHSDFTGTTYRLRDLTKGNGVITLKATSGHPDYTNTSANWNLTGANQYALDAHYGVSQTYAFYKTVFNRNSVNNSGFALTSYVNETATVDNAYWDGSIMHFGVRSANGAGITGIDVTGHELTHGVTQYTCNLNYSNESGAMNESMSDIFGKSVQFWSKPTDVNWLLSNDIGWSIRDMSNPKAFGQPSTYKGTNWYTGTKDNGGVHTNSGIGNLMFYLLVTGGSGTNDLGNSYTIAGIGLTEADAILYRTETVYLTPTSQYANWRTACISAATDLYGANSNEVKQVTNAWYAVGVGAAYSVPNPCTIPSVSLGTPSATSVTITWPSTGAASYNLEWKSSSAPLYTLIQGVTSPYTLNGLTSCTGYQVAVQGVCDTNSSAFSTVSSFTTTDCAVTYCASKGTSQTYEYIKNVTLGTINNTTGSNAGYGNFTALSTNLAGGTSNTISLTPGFASSSYSEYFSVYIDYNHNGVFTDAGELVGQVNSKTTVTKAFTVPATALNGATRMRVQMQYGAYQSNSCATYTYGEVEDYTVNITGNAQFSEGLTGADEPVVVETRLYPNPAQDIVTMQFMNTADGKVRLNVYNLAGQKVITTESGTTEGANFQSVNTNALTGGVYIMEMDNNGTVERHKFVIAR